jgi:hypothetical protein
LERLFSSRACLLGLLDLHRYQFRPRTLCNARANAWTSSVSWAPSAPFRRCSRPILFSVSLSAFSSLGSPRIDPIWLPWTPINSTPILLSRRRTRFSPVITSMNARQIKDEIRRLNRCGKIEIFTWIDQEIGDDLVRRIGMNRSLQIRQELEQRWKVASPERQTAWKDRVSFDSTEQKAVDA